MKLRQLFMQRSLTYFKLRPLFQYSPWTPCPYLMLCGFEQLQNLHKKFCNVEHLLYAFCPIYVFLPHPPIPQTFLLSTQWKHIFQSKFNPKKNSFALLTHYTNYSIQFPSLSFRMTSETSTGCASLHLHIHFSVDLGHTLSPSEDSDLDSLIWTAPAHNKLSKRKLSNLSQGRN
jgi:hypothetical protein